MSKSYQSNITAGFKAFPQLRHLSTDQLFEMDVVSEVLPFKINRHVVENLIDWDKAPNDPIYRILFPVREMIAPEDFEEIADLKNSNAPRHVLNEAIATIRAKLNPHPGGQVEHNVPVIGDSPLRGLQHKYPETVLLFPKQGQTCHAQCTFCFRWAQFIGDREQEIFLEHLNLALNYIARNRTISDIVITGGDPMVMSTRRLHEIIDPLLEPRFEHINNIRIGTKAITFAPQRFVSAPDADELMTLIERATQAGKRVAFMLHLNHPRELLPNTARQAITRLLDAGAVLRSQAPLLARVNDSGRIWEDMWRQHVSLGISPYYMFVERNTGAQRYFSVPLWRAHRIFQEAITSVSGLSRTCRGPIMSTLNGKVEIMGTMDSAMGPAFLLRYIQARSPHFAYTPFLAKFDRGAKWLTDLKPLNPNDSFYFSSDVWPPTHKQKREAPIIRLNRRATKRGDFHAVDS